MIEEQVLPDANEVEYVSLDEALVLYAEIAAHYAAADLAEQAATLLWGIAENQPFIDGNKRIALVNHAYVSGSEWP